MFPMDTDFSVMNMRPSGAKAKLVGRSRPVATFSTSKPDGGAGAPDRTADVVSTMTAAILQPRADGHRRCTRTIALPIFGKRAHAPEIQTQNDFSTIPSVPDFPPRVQVRPSRN